MISFNSTFTEIKRYFFFPLTTIIFTLCHSKILCHDRLLSKFEMHHIGQMCWVWKMLLENWCGTVEIVNIDNYYSSRIIIECLVFVLTAVGVLCTNIIVSIIFLTILYSNFFLFLTGIFVDFLFAHSFCKKISLNVFIWCF